MFKQRLLTTLVLVPLVLLAIYFANRWAFGAAVLLLLLICATEWWHLIPLKSWGMKLLFLAAIGGMVVLTHYGLDYWLWAGLIVWGLIFIAVVSFPASQPMWGHPWLVAVAGLFLLSLFGQSMMRLFLQPQGRDLLVYLLFLVWAADIGAYLAGKQWGRHKLIPAVSPGKTFEGAMGGFLFSLLIALLAYFYFKPQSILAWFLVAILTTLISMLGDLFISMLKRRVKLKDTGQLIPGHGGVLDRLDSLIAALPFFYFGLSLFAAGY